MSQKALLRLARRAVFDALIGFAAFIFLSALAFEDRSQAGVAQLLTQPVAGSHEAVGGPGDFVRTGAPASELTLRNSGEGLIFRQTDRLMALIILGTVFSLLVAFNLAFFRHLRRAYAPRRRRRQH